MKVVKRIFLVIIVLAIILVGGFYVFVNNVSDTSKKEFYKNSGIEDTGFLEDLDMSNFIYAVEVTNRNKLTGGFVLNGTLENDHDSKSVSSIVLYFRFKDGSKEERTIYKNIGPGQLKLFRITIDGKNKHDIVDWGVQSAQ